MKKFGIIAMVLGLGFACLAIDKATEPQKEVNAKTSLAYIVEDGLPLTVTVKTIQSQLFMTAELDGVPYCISNESSVMFDLENGNTVEIQNVNGNQCGFKSKYVMQVSRAQANDLTQSPVKQVKLMTTNGGAILDIINDKDFFVRTLG